MEVLQNKQTYKNINLDETKINLDIKFNNLKDNKCYIINKKIDSRFKYSINDFKENIFSIKKKNINFIKIFHPKQIIIIKIINNYILMNTLKKLFINKIIIISI